MTRHERQFPLVADHEPVITAPRVMQLYDNDDLITNIRGNYQDKVYGDQVSGGEHAVTKPSPQPVPVVNQPLFEPAEKARQEARADLKKKRQAMITPEKAPMTRPARPATKSAASSAMSQEKGWSKYAQHLHQDTYILAELPQTYQEPRNPSAKAVKKNSYDFLKRSQIYNQDANNRAKERRVVQELNLSRFEDIN